MAKFESLSVAARRAGPAWAREQQSQCRQRLRALEERRGLLLQHLGEPPPPFEGSLVEGWKTCGHARCRCARGERHGPYAMILRCLDGERVSEAVDRANLPSVRKRAEEDRRWRRQLRELREIEREVHGVLHELRRMVGVEGDAEP